MTQHSLTIQSVRMSDAGEYSVVAGASMSKGRLSVEGRDVEIKEPAERDVTVITSLPHTSHKISIMFF